MSRALLLLIALQFRGWIRFGFRGLANFKGAALAILGLSVLLIWLFSLFWRTPDTRALDPLYIRAFGPAALAGYCLLNLLLASGENALYFTPPEVGFLFPAPLSRRQLVGYKLLATSVVGIPTALIMAALLFPYSGSFLAALLGITLILMFMHLFGAALQLLIAAIGAQFFRRGKRLFVLTAVLALVAVSGVARWQGGPDFVFILLAGLHKTAFWKICLQPFSWFIEVFLSQLFWPDLILFVSLSSLVNVSLLAVVVTLDTLNLESLAASSARLYTRIQRLRGRPVVGEVDEEHGFLLALPSFPWLGGIGPILWRQLTTALRQPGRLLLAALPFGFLLIGPLLATAEESARAVQTVPVLVFGVLWVSLFLTALFPFDFRGDMDRMAMLKTLPMPGWRLVVGQLAAPVLLVSCIQVVVLGALHFILPRPQLATSAVAGLVLPFNFLLFALENLLFLLFPMRVVGANPGDFQTIGKNVLILLARIFGLALALVPSGAVGVLAFFLFRTSWLAGCLAACLTLAAIGAALVPLVALAFASFDVSRDVPA